MNRSIIIAVCLGLCALPLFAQAPAQEIPYVDVKAAEAEIAVIDKDLADLKSANDKLQSEISDLQKQIDDTREPIAKAVALNEDCRIKLVELHDLLAKVQDEVLQAKVRDAIAKTREVASASSGRKATMDNENAARNRSIKEKRDQTQANRVTMERKEMRKAFLQAAIAKTKAQEDNFNKHMAKVEEFMANNK